MPGLRKEVEIEVERGTGSREEREICNGKICNGSQYGTYRAGVRPGFRIWYCTRMMTSSGTLTSSAEHLIATHPRIPAADAFL